MGNPEPHATQDLADKIGGHRAVGVAPALLITCSERTHLGGIKGPPGFILLWNSHRGAANTILTLLPWHQNGVLHQFKHGVAFQRPLIEVFQLHLRGTVGKCLQL